MMMTRMKRRKKTQVWDRIQHLSSYACVIAPRHPYCFTSPHSVISYLQFQMTWHRQAKTSECLGSYNILSYQGILHCGSEGVTKMQYACHIWRGQDHGKPGEDCSGDNVSMNVGDNDHLSKADLFFPIPPIPPLFLQVSELGLKKPWSLHQSYLGII